MPVRIEDMTEAFEFANTNGDMGEFHAYVCKQTGKIHFQTDFPDTAELYDELPDDIDDEEKYVALPDKRELGLGKPLVLDFAREFLPDDFDDVRDAFSRRGAYPKFKALLVRRGAIDRWHAFESESHGAGIARLVRAAFDRHRRLIKRATRNTFTNSYAVEIACDFSRAHGSAASA